MSALRVIKATWHEDGTATVLGRATARNGSGSPTGVRTEGNFLKQSNVSTITCAVYDRSSSTPANAIETPTVTISTSVLDTVVTTSVLWDEDTVGYNFLHDLANTNFPNGDVIYRVTYTWTLTGGEVFRIAYEGRAEPSVGS